MKTTIVTTTINVPYFLRGYEKNAKLFNQDVDFIVAGDLKTPLEAKYFCRTVSNCVYLSPKDQDTYLLRFPELANHLPYNSAERRNVAMLMAYENGADTVITLDDDNYATSHDVIGYHAPSKYRQKVKAYGSSSGWFNICSVLQEKNNVEFYHRGYPLAQRWNDGLVTVQHAESRIAVNAGLWLDNPDVDAITRLERELFVTGYKNEGSETFALVPGTWTPFNCQNTSLRRDVVPAYFLSPKFGRHSDILASFIVNRLTEHFGDVIAFGDPLARHQRSTHNLWKDFDAERQGILMADKFCEALRSIRITAKSYHEGFKQIADKIRLYGEEYDIEGMLLWHEAFKSLGAE